MKLEERNRARSLRQEGLSIKQIATSLSVSKDSVSAWVRDIELTEDKLANIENRKEQARERSRKTRLINIAQKNIALHKKCREEILPFLHRDLWIAGLMLYAGEGRKSPNVSSQRVEIANSEPAILRIFIKFLTRICSVPRNKIRVRLFIYQDIDPVNAQKFWQEPIGV